MELPYDDPSDWLIAHIDIETTGTKPGFHEAVDVGAVICTLEGEIRDEFHCRILPVHPDRAGEQIQSINGFTMDRWIEEGALSKQKAVNQIQSFLRAYSDVYHLIFCAYNESFDYPFLDHLFRSVDEDVQELFNYTMDLPSIAWGAGLTQLHGNIIVEELGIEDEPKGSDPGTDPAEHTGLTGARKNVRIYRALLEEMPT